MSIVKTLFNVLMYAFYNKKLIWSKPNHLDLKKENIYFSFNK